MRDYKFRAKAVHGNEWVYGNLIHSKRFAGCGNEYRIHNMDTGLESDVDPDTVGQYIEMNDRKNIEIYEGDIIKGQAVLTDSYGYDTAFHVQGVVRFDEEHSSFTFRDTVKHPIENYTNFLWQMDESTIEVIGNIHDLIPSQGSEVKG